MPKPTICLRKMDHEIRVESSGKLIAIIDNVYVKLLEPMTYSEFQFIGRVINDFDIYLESLIEE